MNRDHLKESHGELPLRLINNCAYHVLLFARLEPAVEKYWDNYFGYEASLLDKLIGVIQVSGVDERTADVLLNARLTRNDIAHGRVFARDLDLSPLYRAIERLESTSP
jgi:hypothetical protein